MRSSLSTVIGCRAEPGKRSALTYRFTLLIGQVENMYMPRHVRANHLKQGEMMLTSAASGLQVPVEERDDPESCVAHQACATRR